MERHHSTKLIQHLGILAGVCKEIRLAEMIDRYVDNGGRKVTVGEAVVAMVLNAMGFTGRPLYLTPRFYESRPLDTLICEGPKADRTPSSVFWFIEGRLGYDEQRIEAERLRKGKFIVATKELNQDILSDEKIIEVYKDQNVSVERVMALIMIMTLSLLVYSLAEQRIRAALKEEGAHIWDQKNKPTDKPTAGWVFTIFEDVVLLYIHSPDGLTVQAMNLRAEHEIVLGSLGEQYRKMYFL